MLDRWLVRAFVSEPERVSDPRTRAEYGVLEGWVSIVVNLGVFAAKLIPGILIGSIALVADAIHSLGDVLSSVVVIWGFREAARPSDPEHPFGHGRAEGVATLVIGILLFVAAWEVGQNSVLVLLRPKPVVASNGLIVLLIGTLVAKEWLSRFARRLGRTIDSGVLEGDFWHHRSDVFATAVVIGALVAARSGWQWVDGVGGLAIAGFIAWVGYQLTRDAVNPLIGEAPSPQLLADIRAAANSVPEVEQVHDIIVHSYGGVMVTSMHIEVPDSLDIVRAHDVAEAVETAVRERFPGWAVVHVDPVNRAHPLYGEMDAFLRAIVPGMPHAEGFHDLRIVGSRDPCYVIFDLKADVHHAPAVADELRRAVCARFPDVAKVVVNVEPHYVY